MFILIPVFSICSFDFQENDLKIYFVRLLFIINIFQASASHSVNENFNRGM